MPETFSGQHDHRYRAPQLNGTEENQNPVPTTKKEPTRRGFLKTVLKVAAGVATAEVVRQVKMENVANGLESLATLVRENKCFKEIYELEEQSKELKKKYNFQTLEDISPEDLPLVRADFKKMYGKKVSDIFSTLDRAMHVVKKNNYELGRLDKLVLAHMYRVLRDFSMHGKIYHFLSKRGLYAESRKLPGIPDESIEFMKVRVEDFLPNSQHITKNEFDILWNDKDYRNTLWKQDVYFEQARNLLAESNKEVRDFFNQHDLLPMSGVFSLLKAVIRFRLEERSATDRKKISDKQLLDQLWSERQEFWDEVIIDKETEVIGYFGTEKRFGASEKGFLNTLKKFSVKKNTSFDAKNDDNAKEHVLDKLQHSTGKTALIMDMHGGYDHIDDGKKRLFAVEMAKALWERIRWYKEHKPNQIHDALKELKIIQFTCLPYDFYLSFTRELQVICHRNGVNYSKITPCRVIMANEPGSSTRGYYMWEAFDKYQHVLEKRKDMRGKDFLMVEPELYCRNGDLTINSIKRGATHHISELTPQTYEVENQVSDRKV